MKTRIIALSLGCVLGMLATAQPTDPPTSEEPVAIQAEAPPPDLPPPPEIQAAPTQEEAPPAEAQSAAQSQAASSQNQGPANAQVTPAQSRASQAPAQAAQPKSQAPLAQAQTAPLKEAQTAAANATPAEVSKLATASTSSTPTHVVAEGEKGLRLNFRGAPLELVLDYLSEAAGFIIRPEVDVKGKVDVWSNQPLTKDEAVELLNSVLNKNGFAALRDGRTLTIVTRDEAKRRGGTPVKSGNDPAAIPKNDEIVTQIVPVRFINAVQLTKDLQPLLPSQATMTANEAGNALVITDTQFNIRRMTEIIKALDTSIASVSAVRVFALRYADAKSVADVIKEVFQTQSSSANDVRARFFARFRGGPFGGPPGGDTGSDTTSTSGGRPGASRVSAVADERSNSLVVSAPDDLMPTIEELVKSVDVNVEDVTEVRVFHLKYSDPQEMADLLSNLFPDQSNTQGNQGFGRFFNFGPGRQAANTDTDQSDRMKKRGRVVAVPDARTASVVVSAARDMMDQIAKMIVELDSDPAKKQKVFVFDVQNTDPQQVQNILQGLFPSQNSGTVGGTRTTSGQTGTGNQLNTRANQTQGQNVNRSTSIGGSSSGFGTGTGGTTGR